jgi:SAM-dependent methyltransferase
MARGYQRERARRFSQPNRRTRRVSTGMSSSKAAVAYEPGLIAPPLPNDSLDPYEVSLWDVEFLRTPEFLGGRRFGISDRAKTVRFPVRMLRYWFTYHLLGAEYRRRGRPLDILELGTHNGQMLTFARLAAARMGAKAPRYRRWLGVDAVPKRNILRLAGYQDILHADIEAPNLTLPDGFDCAICLHILEHTADPLGALRKVAASLRPGGSIIGGSPVLPHFLVRLRERQLRRTAQQFGHVTVFSPQRVRALAETAGLTIEFLSGAYCLRHKGFFLENSRAWLRFNLRWGRAFAWWPGEIHWLARKAR